MTRLVRSTEHHGSISLITRVDATELPTLADHVDAGANVEITVSEQLVDNARKHLNELVAGGVHVTLCGPPAALHCWLTALQAGDAERGRQIASDLEAYKRAGGSL